MLPKYVEKYLHRIAKSNNLSAYKFETQAGSNHGDNFLGVMIAVTISGMKNQQHVDNQIQHLQLICKTQPSNEERNKQFQTDVVFDREVFMYAKVLPAFVRFQQEKGLSEADSFLSFPKVYVTEFDDESKKYILIMEDLRPKRYEMWPKENQTPIEHELLVLRELGKFHAISLAMKDQRPNEFKQFSEMAQVFVHTVVPTWKPLIDEAMEKARDVLKSCVHKKLMQSLIENCIELYEEFLCGPLSKEFGVVGHGDFWNNNYLFQYANQNDEATGVCFVDWQMGYYGSITIDLMLNLFTSTDGQTRKNHYERLLKTYYSALSATVQKLGSDANKLFTFDDLQAELKIFGRVVLSRAVVSTQLIVANAKDVEDMDKYTEKVSRGEKAHLMKEYDDETKQKYSSIINELVTDLVNYGYIDS